MGRIIQKLIDLMLEVLCLILLGAAVVVLYPIALIMEKVDKLNSK